MKSFRKTAIVFVFVLILLTLFMYVPVFASFQPESWQYSKELTAEKSGFSLIDLDAEVLKHSNQDLTDIRIIDQNGRELPYQQVGLAPDLKSYPATLFDVAVNADYTLATLDVGKEGRLHNEISLDVKPLKNSYLREVTVEASNDNQNWVMIAKDKIFNLNQQKDPAMFDQKEENFKVNQKDNYIKNELNYAPVSYRYLRLKIDRQAGEPLVVTGAVVNFASNSEYTSAVLPSTIISNRGDYKTKFTDIIVDLGVPNYIVNDIRLEIQDNNYERAVYCYTGKDLSEWSVIAKQDIYNYQWQGYQAERNELEVHFVSNRYLKLSINNQDSPELSISQISIYGSAPKLLVNLQEGNNTLWYGNSLAQMPAYDLSKFAAQVDQDNLPIVGLGAEKLNSIYQAPLKPWTERNRWVLNVVLVLTAAILSVFAFRNLSKV